MPLNLATYEWKLPAEVPDVEPLIKDLQQAGLQYSPAFLRLCLNRGLDTAVKIQAATDPAPQLFHDPFLMHDMQKAVDRITAAVHEGQQICIYGDYDADGITSTLIVLEALETIGAQVSYYLPNRHEDGYGPNLERYQELIAGGAELIITVDNGIAGLEAIAYAQEQGVDVIVTDHHQIQEHLPPAYAIVHPAHPDASYPFPALAGAGVALKLVAALLGEVPADSLELAAIGTVADLVPLTDENRTIVLSGLAIMKQSQRLGLVKLFERNHIQTADLNSRTIGFTIGPRLNALGRLGDPTPGLQLLSTYDPEEADHLLDKMEETNAKRQQLVEEIYQSIVTALEERDDLPPIIMAADEAWNVGVLGIVASRLTDRYHRPAIIFQRSEVGYKGSGRSIQSINLFEMLQEASHTIQYFGGHSQAAGLTVTTEQWPAFQKALLTLAKGYEAEIMQPDTLEIDVSLKLSDIDEALINEFALLEPFGMENEEPLVYLQAVELSQSRLIGRKQNHLKLEVQEGKETLQAIGFSKAEQGRELTTGEKIDLVGSLSINEWNNQRLPQLQIEDLGTPETVWIDVRGSQIPPQLKDLESALFVFQHQALCDHYAKEISNTSKAMIYEEAARLPQGAYPQLVIMEPPANLEDFKTLMQGAWSKVYLGSYVHQSHYMIGLPQREEAGLLYRWIHQHPEFQVRKTLPQLSQATGIHPHKLEVLILMFYQAGFVTIEDGTSYLEPHKSQQKVDLEEMPAYISYKNAYEAEKLLNYQRMNVIQEYLEGKE